MHYWSISSKFLPFVYLFRDFLHNSLCEENLAFFLDVSEFLANYHMAENSDSLDAAGSVRAMLAIAYGKLNTFGRFLDWFPCSHHLQAYTIRSWLPDLPAS